MNDRLRATTAFGVAGLLVAVVWWLPILVPSARLVIVVLYVCLPGLAAAVAGGIGAPLLAPDRCRSGGGAALRGAGIAIAALALFAPLLALGVKWTEPGWTNPVGLATLILLFSLLAVGWIVAFVGAFVGWLVWRRATRR